MKKQQGLTLIEIMIALVLGLFIIAATLTVYINTIKSSADTLKSVRLNHDLGMAMSLMSNEIKRAGYWGGAVIGSSSLLTNPFMSAATNVNILTVTTTGDCILYSYDADADRIVDAETAATGDTDADGKIDNEYYGFRLRAGAIDMRLSGQNTTNCNNANDSWQMITDGNMVNVTALRFSFLSLDAADGSSPCTNTALSTCLAGTSRCYNAASGLVTNALTCSNPPTPVAGNQIAQKRIVNIQLTGRLIGADNAEVIKTLSDTVKVRSNRVFTCTAPLLPCN